MMTFVIFILVILVLYVVMGGGLFFAIGMALGHAVRIALKGMLRD